MARLPGRPCVYRGKRERCLVPFAYPITKNRKLSCKRVRNAAARAAQQKMTAQIKRGGFCRAAQICGVQSKLCR